MEETAQKQVTDMLINRHARLVCRCGARNNLVVDGIWEVRRLDKPEILFPEVRLVCKQCTLVSSYSAAALGIVTVKTHKTDIDDEPTVVDRPPIDIEPIP